MPNRQEGRRWTSWELSVLREDAERERDQALSELTALREELKEARDYRADHYRYREALEAVLNSLDEAEPAARKLPPSVLRGVFYWSRDRLSEALHPGAARNNRRMQER